MSNEKSMVQRLIEQSERGPSAAGWHKSRSDSNKHLSIKNSNGTVIEHMYEDGSVKGTNEGGSGALNWFTK